MAVFITGGGVNPSRLLPVGYTQLAYIESTGTQYIKTGIVPSSSGKSEVIFACSQTSGAAIFGAENAWKSNMYSVYSHLAGFGAETVSLTVTSEMRSIGINAGIVTVNGASVSTLSGSFTGSYELVLFARNRTGRIGEYSTGKIQIFTYSDDTGAVELIPCKTPSGDIGMYDIVNGVFLRNSGSGQFLAGPEV